MTKAQALSEFAKILAPLNERLSSMPQHWAFGDFVRQVYFPFYRRKWKGSTAVCNEYRVNYHLVSEFDPRKLGSFKRDELQGFLDGKAVGGLSYSTVAHLRWDVRQIFGMAELRRRYARAQPRAELLFTPRSVRDRIRR